MKKIWFLLFITLFIGNLSANEPVTNEQAIPATASQALNNHVTNVKKFLNTNKRELKHAAKIGNGVAKIGGAFALSYFTFSMGKTLRMVSTESKSFMEKKKLVPAFSDWWNPVMVGPKKLDGSQWGLFAISRPPYLTSLAISTYLLYDGGKDLYKEVCKMLKENKEDKKVIKNKQVNAPINSEEIEISIATPADATISNEGVVAVTLQNESIENSAPQSDPENV